MSYVGEKLEHCRVVPFNWNDTWLVVVNGDGINICGHALFKAGSYYFHILGQSERPWYMNEEGYRRYKTECGKNELFRRKVVMPDPVGAQRKLEELSLKPWIWLVVPNNCVSYVEEIFRAGGARVSSFSNCPVGWR